MKNQYDLSDFSKHLKALILEIRAGTNYSMNEVYQVVSAKMLHFLELRMGKKAALDNAWHVDSIRAYTSINAKHKRKMIPQQYLDVFTATYYHLVPQVNYERVMALYESDGLSISKADIDELGENAKYEEEWKTYFNNTDFIKEEDITSLIKQYLISMLNKGEFFLLAEELPEDQVDRIPSLEGSFKEPLKSIENYVLQYDFDLDEQIKKLRIKEAIESTNGYHRGGMSRVV